MHVKICSLKLTNGDTHAAHFACVSGLCSLYPLFLFYSSYPPIELTISYVKKKVDPSFTGSFP